MRLIGKDYAPRPPKSAAMNNPIDAPRRALIFDLDGTLCDTLPLIYDCFRDVLLRFTGRRFADDEIAPLFGPPEEGVLERVLPPTEAAEALESYLDLYRSRHARYVPLPAAQVRDLSGFRDEGVRLGVVTGKGIGTARITLAETGLADLFDVVLTGSVGFKRKPAPDGVRLVMRALGAEAGRSVFVGDHLADVRAARAAECTAVAAAWYERHDPRVRAADAGADHVFERWEDFVDWARGWVEG
ncbi:MAG TPA: HAD family hydrolase [Bacillota bacterium]